MTATLESYTESCEEDCGGQAPRPFEIQSYANLLKFPKIPASAEDMPSGDRDITVPVVDAIIVPTIRSAEQITSAVELASRARCQLVIFYTDNFPAGLSPIFGRLKQGMVTPLALRSDAKHDLLDLAADLPQSLVSSCALDISKKRNLGLMIGRARRWTRMLFLDDDIRRLGVAKLSSAAALLDTYPVVGLQVNKYPDASAVGHARRLAGRRQEPFVSGGSLLVNPQLLNGFFPPIYHEDWLCVINHLRRGEVAVGGTVGQLPYKPFTTPERARFEEFGDILASGLLWLVHARHGKSAASNGSSEIRDLDYWHDATRPRFWEEILNQRAELLDRLVAHLMRMNLPDLSPLPSVEAARQRCGELEAKEFVSFTKKWVNGLGVWRDWLSFPHADSIGKALAALGLLHVVRAHEEPARQVPASGPRRTFGCRWGRWGSTDNRRRFGSRT